MRVYSAQIHFEKKKEVLSIAVVTKNRTTALKAIDDLLSKPEFRGKKVSRSQVTSRKVQGQCDNWGRTTVAWTLV